MNDTDRAEPPATLPPEADRSELPTGVDHPIPPAAALPAELEQTALIGRLLTSLDAYAAEAEEDRVRAREDRVKAELDRRQFRAWFARSNATQDAQLGLIRGDIQRINRRLEEGDAEFRTHRAELAAKDERIAKLVDCVAALNLEVQSLRTAPAPASKAQPSEELGGLLVLILEDDDTLRGTVTRVCQDKGASVVAVSTIAEASRVLESGAPHPDVVTVDLKLAHSEDAFPFVRELRANHQQVGVLILTGAIRPDQEAEAIDLGVAVVTKPFDLRQLVDAIKFAARRQ